MTKLLKKMILNKEKIHLHSHFQMENTNGLLNVKTNLEMMKKVKKENLKLQIVEIFVL